MDYTEKELSDCNIIQNIAEHSDYLKYMETYAKEHRIPIIEPEVVKLLDILVNIHKPQRILEIGTAIGYSSIVLARLIKAKGGHIDTIEIDERMVIIARGNIKDAGYDNTITVINGDAKNVLSELQTTYDMVFIDAAKAHYKAFFDECLSLSKEGGLIVCDNVLFRGMIANNELVKRRKITIVKRMRLFLKHVMDNPGLDSIVLPISDGVLISYIKEKEHGGKYYV